jgi:hypothetical protein
VNQNLPKPCVAECIGAIAGLIDEDFLIKSAK